MIDAGLCTLRPFSNDDIEAIVPLASDPLVAQYLADRFPQPYTHEDAMFWIPLRMQDPVHNHFAIEYRGELAGGIGLDPLDAERRHASHVGYWLGRKFWGLGLASAACRALTEHAFEDRGFIRLEAYVYAPNVASMRVLEKCGYVREGLMRKAIIKRGEILDAYMYAKVRE